MTNAPSPLAFAAPVAAATALASAALAAAAAGISSVSQHSTAMDGPAGKAHDFFIAAGMSFCFFVLVALALRKALPLSPLGSFLVPPGTVEFSKGCELAPLLSAEKNCEPAPLLPRTSENLDTAVIIFTSCFHAMASCGFSIFLLAGNSAMVKDHLTGADRRSAGLLAFCCGYFAFDAVAAAVRKGGPSRAVAMVHHVTCCLLYALGSAGIL